MQKRKSSNTGAVADWNNESSVQRDEESEKHNSIVNMQRVSLNPSVGRKQGSNAKPGKISVASKSGGEGKTLNITVMRN